MKRLAAALILTLILWQGFCAVASEEMQVQAKGAALVDAATGRLLWGQNPDQKLPMASTTKVMTAILALENAELSETVTASKNASGVEGTSLYLRVGETLTMEQMLYGLLLRSGNDAAVAIAEHVDGDVEAFVRRMNERAALWGLDASFANPHGLDASGHEASALAMARLMARAMRYPTFRQISGASYAVIPWEGNDFQRVLNNKNRLLRDYAGANGGKTGFTSRAGRCLVFSAQRDGLELCGAVLNCPDWFSQAEKILDYGFANYSMQTPLRAGQTACQTQVKGGVRASVEAVAQEDLCAAVGEGERFSVEYDFGEGVRAPVAQGQPIGTATLYIDGQSVATTPLLAAEALEKRDLLSGLKRVVRQWALQFQP